MQLELKTGKYFPKRARFVLCPSIVRNTPSDRINRLVYSNHHYISVTVISLINIAKINFNNKSEADVVKVRFAHYLIKDCETGLI